MHCFAPTPCGTETKFPKQHQHRDIFRQHLRNEMLKPAVASDQHEVTEQRCPNALALISSTIAKPTSAVSGLRNDVRPPPMIVFSSLPSITATNAT